MKNEFNGINRRIWLSSPFIHEEERKYVREAFDTNWMSTVGANIDTLENNVTSYLGCKYAAALSSGTAALHISVLLAGIKQGDIVLCSDMTFVASVNPVLYEKAQPVFVDSEYDTWNMDPSALEYALKKYGKKVKAVIAADLYGVPAKMDEISELCRRYNVVLIEDAAESLSASYKGRKSGTFGDFNILSFNGNKIITGTSGGMIVSDNENAIKEAKFLSTQARDAAPWYQHSKVGYNYRMSNLVAGVARGQFEHLEEHKRLKKEIWERYKTGLQNLPIEMNPFPKEADPNCWLSCITIDPDACGEGKGKSSPNKIRTTLANLNIESRPIWKPMHLQPLFAHSDYITSNAGTDEDIFSRGLCLPSDLNMTEEEQNYVIEIIGSCF
ncbi:MAG: aminotransferase class I/II-fold pyridoxal phosphate-dependent enzyme [Synergistes sp.]|nr:aminotransferase class I/II-fold pyridoxal phosphate-dependent enzyme [Synergistes sp.]